jgi:ribosome-binding ATPase YchF (GTP1/OBG family)
MVTETEGAVGFLMSMRGRLMMAHALHYGIKELSKVEGVHREVSDIADMQYLKDELFNFPVEILEASIEKAQRRVADAESN